MTMSTPSPVHLPYQIVYALTQDCPMESQLADLYRYYKSCPPAESKAVLEAMIATQEKHYSADPETARGLVSRLLDRGQRAAEAFVHTPPSEAGHVYKDPTFVQALPE